MGRLRRLADAAIAKMDEIGERETAKELSKLTPAERERYEAWEERSRSHVPRELRSARPLHGKGADPLRVPC